MPLSLLPLSFISLIPSISPHESSSFLLLFQNFLCNPLFRLPVFPFFSLSYSRNFPVFTLSSSPSSSHSFFLSLFLSTSPEIPPSLSLVIVLSLILLFSSLDPFISLPFRFLCFLTISRISISPSSPKFVFCLSISLCPVFFSISFPFTSNLLLPFSLFYSFSYPLKISSSFVLSPLMQFFSVFSFLSTALATSLSLAISLSILRIPPHANSLSLSSLPFSFPSFAPPRLSLSTTSSSVTFSHQIPCFPIVSFYLQSSLSPFSTPFRV